MWLVDHLDAADSSDSPVEVIVELGVPLFLPLVVVAVGKRKRAQHRGTAACQEGPLRFALVKRAHGIEVGDVIGVGVVLLKPPRWERSLPTNAQLGRFVGRPSWLGASARSRL